MKFFARSLSFCCLFFTFLGSCKLSTDYFSDYNNKNLISAYDFSVVPVTSGTLRPGWALVSITNSGTDITSNYVRWEAFPTSSSQDTALSLSPPVTGASIYRLEMKNLIPNGDFEDASLSSSYWTVAGTTMPTPLTTYSTYSTYSMDNQFIHWDGTTSTTLTLDLQSAVGTSWLAGQYQFQLDCISLDTNNPINVILHHDSNDDLAWTYDTTAVTTNTRFSLYAIAKNMQYFSLTTPAATDTLKFEANSTSQNLLFDNLRMVRTDVLSSTGVKISLPYLNSTSKDLIPGKYKFYLYVHDDPTAVQGASYNYANRFNPSYITITVTAVTKNGTKTYYSYQARPSAGWSGWTKLTFDLGTIDFVDTNSGLSTSNPVLSIQITPTLVSKEPADAGSILMANPQFMFYQK